MTMQPTWAASALALAGILAMASPAVADTVQSPAPATRHAVHHRHAVHRGQLAAVSPLRPLTPPAHPAATSNAAPVPNPAITPPIDNSDQTASIAPAVMQIHYPPQGDGYTSGSSAQAMDDREAAKVTGVQMKVPLGQ